MSGEIEAGRRSDALVEETVFGRTVEWIGGIPHTTADREGATFAAPVPMYSKFIDYAWGLVESLRDPFMFSLSSCTPPGWSAVFALRSDPHNVYSATADTPSLAICRAALAAVGAQRGEK